MPDHSRGHATSDRLRRRYREKREYEDVFSRWKGERRRARILAEFFALVEEDEKENQK